MTIPVRPVGRDPRRPCKDSTLSNKRYSSTSPPGSLRNAKMAKNGKLSTETLRATSMPQATSVHHGKHSTSTMMAEVSSPDDMLPNLAGAEIAAALEEILDHAVHAANLQLKRDQTRNRCNRAWQDFVQTQTLFAAFPIMEEQKRTAKLDSETELRKSEESLQHHKAIQGSLALKLAHIIGRRTPLSAPQAPVRTDHLLVRADYETVEKRYDDRLKRLEEHCTTQDEELRRLRETLKQFSQEQVASAEQTRTSLKVSNALLGDVRHLQSLVGDSDSEFFVPEKGLGESQNEVETRLGKLRDKVETIAVKDSGLGLDEMKLSLQTGFLTMQEERDNALTDELDKFSSDLKTLRGDVTQYKAAIEMLQAAVIAPGTGIGSDGTHTNVVDMNRGVTTHDRHEEVERLRELVAGLDLRLSGRLNELEQKSERAGANLTGHVQGAQSHADAVNKTTAKLERNYQTTSQQVNAMIPRLDSLAMTVRHLGSVQENLSTDDVVRQMVDQISKQYPNAKDIQTLHNAVDGLSRDWLASKQRIDAKMNEHDGSLRDCQRQMLRTAIELDKLKKMVGERDASWQAMQER